MVFEEFRSFIVERKLAHPDKSVYCESIPIRRPCATPRPVLAYFQVKMKSTVAVSTGSADSKWAWSNGRKPLALA